MTPDRAVGRLEDETTQLKAFSVRLENRPGQLAAVARLLGEFKINIEAVEAEVLGTHGFARFYSNDPAAAEQLLRERGYVVTTTDILEVLVSNKPGELARALEAIAEAGVNVESCFGSGWAEDSRILLRVSDIAKAHRALQAQHFKAYRLTH